MPKTSRYAAFGLLAILFVAEVLCAAKNPGGSHEYRQTDTLGMSLALAIDAGREGLGAFLHTLFYPRLLNRGFTNGINATEFPLLGFLTAPFFWLGPRAGSFLSSTLLIWVNFVTALFGVPRLAAAWKARAPIWLCGLAYFAITSIEWETTLCLPESLALPLLVWGAWLVLDAVSRVEVQARHTVRAALGILLLNLAVAVKPAAVVAYWALAAFPWIVGLSYRRLLWLAAALATSLTFPAWWYAVHAKDVIAAADGRQFFALAKLEPVQRFLSVGGWGVLKLLIRQTQEWQFPFYTGILWVGLAAVWEPVLLVALALSMSTAIALEGTHIWFHADYFFGCAGVSLILILRLVGHPARRFHPAFRAIAIATLAWGVVYGVRTEVWETARAGYLWQESAPLRAAMPAGQIVVSDDTAYPTKLFYLGTEGLSSGPAAVRACQSEILRQHPFVFVLEDAAYQAALKEEGSCVRNSRLIAEGLAPSNWKLLAYQPDSKP